MYPLQKGCFLVLLLLSTSQLNAQSNIRLIKPTVSVAGSLLKSSDGRYSLSQTIAQPSSITRLKYESHTLLQGFEHPFLQAGSNSKAGEATSQLYPNPSEGKFFITHCGLQGDFVQVEVFDLHGRSVLQESVEVNAAGECLINMSVATSGTYQVRMSAGGRSFIGILIVL